MWDQRIRKNQVNLFLLVGLTALVTGPCMGRNVSNPRVANVSRGAKLCVSPD